METAIEEVQASYHVGPVLFLTTQLKRALITEAGSWKCAYGKALNEKCGKEMDELLEFMDTLLKKLLRPTNDLDDVRSHMASLGDIRYVHPVSVIPHRKSSTLAPNLEIRMQKMVPTIFVE